MIEKYELYGLGKEMANLWTNNIESARYSLQELINLFNLRVLKSVCDEAGLDLAPGEGENMYKYLTNEEVPQADHEETRLRLEENGISVDEVLNDFIGSKQTMAKYLRENQGVDFSPENPSKGERKQGQLDNIKKIERRYEKISEGIVKNLISNGDLPQDDFDIDIDCIVTNQSTGENYKIEELLQ
jgi:hypothetical protein